MDDIDQQLISLLRQDARKSIGDLAHKLKVSRGTVNNRLRKLEDSQVIVGYTIKLRPDAEPETIKAWMGVLVEGNTTRQVIASLLGEPGVNALHDTNGRWDLLAEIEAQKRQIAELERFAFGDNRLGVSSVRDEIRGLKFWMYASTAVTVLWVLYEIVRATA